MLQMFSPVSYTEKKLNKYFLKKERERQRQRQIERERREGKKEERNKERTVLRVDSPFPQKV